MLKRILVLLVPFALLFGVFLLVFPVRTFFPGFFLGAAERVLIVYDEPGSASRQRDQADAFALRQLLGHFNVTVDLVTTADYKHGDLGNYSRVFYLGTKEGQTVPSYILDDLADTRVPVWWIGANLDQLHARHAPTKTGFHLVDAASNHPTSSVSYKGRVLWKKDDATYLVAVDDPGRVKVLSDARSAEGPIPWILRAGRFWYAASNPFAFAVEGSAYLVFADLLHDFLGQDHGEDHRAMVRVEDIHVMRDPAEIRRTSDYLAREGVPFGFTLIPVYRHDDDAPSVYMNENPAFLDAVHEMVSRGGVPVLHGGTHRRSGETAVDYEFWSGTTGGPLLDDSRELVAQKLHIALQECFQNRLYPLAWTTPHYAASQFDYRVIKDFFTTAWERRQPVDVLGTDQFFPYVIRSDMHEQILIPETLGYLTADGTRSPQALLEDAANTLVVRDGYATFFYHPYLPLSKLEEMVAGLRRLGYRFQGLTEFNNITRTDDRVVLSGTVEVVLNLDGRFLHEFTVDEDGNRTNETYSFRPISGEVHRYITMKPGRIKIMEAVATTPPLTWRTLGMFRPSLTGVTHPLALVLLFVGLMILITFLVIWVYLLLQKTVRTARRGGSRGEAA